VKTENLLKYGVLITGVIYGGFFLLMALDTFPKEFTGRNIAGYLLSSAPGAVVLLTLVLGFKRPLFGAVIFAAIALFTLYFFRSYEHFLNVLFITVPAIIIASLFSVMFVNSKKSNPDKI
jgi:hypothetical protein